MAELHLFHSGVEGTTDVLTFDLRQGAAGPLEVEIVACLDEARRMAGAGPVERELLLYLLHGALHCLGHDDHDPEGFARMHEREDEILLAIGVGAVFDGGFPGAGGER
jgi:probable rRNA maturation factor